MKEDMNDRLDRARTLASENIERAGNRAKAVGAKAGEKIADARDKAGKAVDNTNRIITEHPLASIAAAVAVGALASYLFPRSAKSLRAAGPKIAAKAASAKREASGIAQAGLENARDLASSVGEQIESGIQKSGLPDKVADAAAKISTLIRKQKGE